MTAASVGGPVGGAQLPDTTDASVPQDLPDQTTIYLGARAQAEIALPAGSGVEVVVGQAAGAQACGALPLPAAGVIIDDLRVE